MIGAASRWAPLPFPGDAVLAILPNEATKYLKIRDFRILALSKNRPRGGLYNDLELDAGPELRSAKQTHSNRNGKNRN
jgi:hypothetical protein